MVVLAGYPQIFQAHICPSMDFAHKTFVLSHAILIIHAITEKCCQPMPTHTPQASTMLDSTFS